MNTDKIKVTLSNSELIEKCSKWISDLCKSGGSAWTLRVPVDFNRDPDILFTELIRRFHTALNQIDIAAQEQWVEIKTEKDLPEYGAYDFHRFFTMNRSGQIAITLWNSRSKKEWLKFYTHWLPITEPQPPKTCTVNK